MPYGGQSNLRTLVPRMVNLGWSAQQASICGKSMPLPL
jgi:hypothetical protein